MNTISNFHKAERKKGKLRLGIAGPAGSGKTYSALLMAFGMEGLGSWRLAPDLAGKIAMIDTERGSGELYDHLGNYDVCTIEAPFEPGKYVAAIKDAEKLGYETIIIDSLTHAWAGQGGLLDTHGKIADRGGNSWAAWRKVTPQHNELVDAMLQSSCHIIATMRSKMEYAQSEEGGKKTVKKLGMSPIQREGMEYEFTVFLDLDLNHVASSSKDRTSLFDGKYFTPAPETGITLINWLNNAPEAELPQQPAAKVTQENKNSSETSEQTIKQEKQADSGSTIFKPIFAKLNAFGLSDENYKQYCCQRYKIKSMTELSAEQTSEQVKLLDSLKKPERLKSFQDILGVVANEQKMQNQPPVTATVQ
jgi:hypothetical protein